MTIARRPAPPLFSQVDVTTATHTHAHPAMTRREEQTELLREVLAAQDRTNELLEELGTVLAATQKQRANELNQWRNAHPALPARVAKRPKHSPACKSNTSNG